jgi:hypothetical protein
MLVRADSNLSKHGSRGTLYGLTRYLVCAPRKSEAQDRPYRHRLPFHSSSFFQVFFGSFTEAVGARVLHHAGDLSGGMQGGRRDFDTLIFAPATGCPEKLVVCGIRMGQGT